MPAVFPCGGSRRPSCCCWGSASAATSQVTGPLLVFALLVMPAASAQALTSRPGPALAASVAIGLVVVWLGLGVSYFSVYPPGFWIAVVAFAGYLLARLAASRAGGRRHLSVAGPLDAVPASPGT